MNYHSDKKNLIEHYVLHCKGFNAKDMCYEYLKLERCLELPHERYLMEAYDFKRFRSVFVSLHIRDWVTGEPLPLFLVGSKQTALCFDDMYITVYDLPHVDGRPYPSKK
jgi:hypothetical protein